MGHALDHTLMDALTRRKRMQGYEVLWLPGMDHAGIATQIAWWRSSSPSTARPRRTSAASCSSTRSGTGSTSPAAPSAGRCAALGDGVDWSRDRFTMDDGLSRAVRTIFKRLYDAGLIYQAERLVNWSPVLRDRDLRPRGQVRGRRGRAGVVPVRLAGRRRTAHRGGHHPGRDDARRHRDRRAPRRRAVPRTWSARTLPHPFLDREIIIVADAHVDPEFGTGAVKVTPAHDPNDFEIGLRHKLPMPTIMDTKGRIADTGTEFDGMDRFDARVAVREALAARGPHRRGEATVPAQRRALRAQRRTHRAAAVAAVVGQGRVAGQGRR